MDITSLQLALASLTADLEEFKATIEPPQVIERWLTEEELIRNYAAVYGVNPDMAVAVAKCESSLNPNAIGDGGHSRGLWQIHRPSHPYMTDEKAFNPEESTKWAMPRLKETPRIWTCYRNIYGA